MLSNPVLMVVVVVVVDVVVVVEVVVSRVDEVDVVGVSGGASMQPGITSISMIEFGDKNILIEPSRNLEVTLAIVYSGEGQRDHVEEIAKAIHYELEFTFGKKLKDFDGNLDKIRGIREVMVNHI